VPSTVVSGLIIVSSGHGNVLEVQPNGALQQEAQHNGCSGTVRSISYAGDGIGINIQLRYRHLWFPVIELVMFLFDPNA
jgi:hypothetical protein